MLVALRAAAHRARLPVAVIVVAAAAVALPVTSPPHAAPRPVPPSVSSLPVHGVDLAARGTAPSLRGHEAPREDGSTGHMPPGATMRALTKQAATAAFSVLGLSWSGSAPTMSAHVRYRSGGTWSDWYELATGDGHGPDPGTAEARRARRGSDPLIVPESDGVQVRVDAAGPVPADLRIDLIDPGTSPADATVGSPGPAQSAAAEASRPTILTRADWGADESLRRGDPAYGTVKVGFVHHTAGTNSYTQSQVPSIIRGIYAYHVKSLGWDDIGYNFLVDKWGRIWEGRYGGVSKPVIGAHTLGYNDQSFGMSALGTYTSTTPTSATVSAFERLFAWKLGLSYVDPTRRTTLTKSDGTTHTFDNVSGHRDAYPTECPGDALYAKLGTIRSTARSDQGTMFYRPRRDRSHFTYQDGAGVTLTAPVSRSLSWRLTVTHPCGGTIAVRSGTATTSSGISATWHGHLTDGRYAPPGRYDLTLTAWSGTSRLATARTYRSSVRIDQGSSWVETMCPIRLSGSNRYATSVDIARSTSPNATTVVLASGEEASMSDSLAAGTLARAKDAALLLTRSDTLPSAVQAEITRRGATTAYLIGGTSTISDSVRTQLSSLGVTGITRISGPSRYATAAAVARAVTSTSSQVIVASGEQGSLVDGISASGVAAARGLPVLLVRQDAVPTPTRQALADLGSTSSVVVGGTTTISGAVAAELPSATRVAGSNRYQTATAMASWARAHGVAVGNVLVSSGADGSLIDALVGGQRGEVLLYSRPRSVPSTTVSWLSGSSSTQVVRVLGGTSSVGRLPAGTVRKAIL